MNSEEYQEIIQFLREQKYPDTIQYSRQTRWNYKRKLSSYFIAECDTLFKVRFYLYPENDSFILINNHIIYILIKIQWMDLICDFSESEDGYKHILVTVSYLSKYVAVRPLKSKTSEEVIKNLKNIYLDMGLPDIIQHDQGREGVHK